MTLCSLKTEAPDDGPSQQRQEEPNGTARCISGVFAAHGKLRRLLGTLVQFAMDMSPEVGDSVRSLVLGLLSGSMSAEEFHSALQDATNFPLRGFVLPYLKHCLPSLQRDLNAAARADNQSCAQYLRSNEPAVLEAVGLGSGGASGAEGSVEFFAEHASSGPPAATPKHHYPAMRSAGTTAHTPATAGPQLAYSHASKRRASEAL
ncbi:protein CBFA2T3-like [Copidosoma floridanum]|uniref:protein CBFA2T3-like n=1 Tax=Copidosoma floridanum TaxID=29053 RepID=UPI000C6F4AF1|nr:protein CBFA2T3-like [Copidosoma floridanum]